MSSCDNLLERVAQNKPCWSHHGVLIICPGLRLFRWDGSPVSDKRNRGHSITVPVFPWFAVTLCASCRGKSRAEEFLLVLPNYPVKYVKMSKALVLLICKACTIHLLKKKKAVLNQNSFATFPPVPDMDKVTANFMKIGAAIEEQWLLKFFF